MLLPFPRRPSRAAALLLAMASATPALAARPDPTASRTAVAQAISDCRKVSDRDARLECYDKAADAFEQAQAEGQVKRQAFGLSLPSLDLFPKGAKEPEVDRVSIKLTGAHQDQNSRWIMTTDEGAVWSQIDSQELLNEPHAGSTVAIRRAALGSYFCNVDGQSAIRCARSQ
jgi:hypothetical protein